MLKALEGDNRAKALTLVVTALTGLGLASLLFGPGQSNGAAASGATASAAALTTADISKIQAVGYLLSTKAGTQVQVVRASGSDVWASLFPDVNIGPDTNVVESHDMLVVRATTDVPQSSRDQVPGSAPVTIAVVSLVIDATTGRVIETITAPAGVATPVDDISVLGQVSYVSLTNVAAPTAPEASAPTSA